MGLAMRFTNGRREYAVVIHDGMGVVGSERDVREGDVPSDLIDRILDRAKEYAKARGHRVSDIHLLRDRVVRRSSKQIAIFAVAGPLDEPLSLPDPSLDVDRDAPISFLSRVWLDLDAIPFIACVRDTQFSLQGEAVLAVEKALETLSPTTKTIIQAATSKDQREVLGMRLSFYAPIPSILTISES
jgi:alpha,alpha-trehalose phosphorylase (configuration-retaining)